MRQIKVSEAEGALLDFWANMALGGRQSDDIYPYSTDWNVGGQVIERERVELRPLKGGAWVASIGTVSFQGDTALVAVMRCVVARKYGDTVDPVQFR